MTAMPNPAVSFKAYLKMLSPGQHFPEILVPSPHHSMFPNHYSTFLRAGPHLFCISLNCSFLRNSISQICYSNSDISPEQCSAEWGGYQ